MRGNSQCCRRACWCMNVWGVIKSSFIAGIILLTPLVVTVYVLWILSGWLLGVVNPVVQGTQLAAYTNNEVVAQFIAGGGIVFLVVILGFIAQQQVGKRTFRGMGRVVNVVPLVNLIYGSVRQVANALVMRDSDFEQIVLVEYPREGVYRYGLVTGDSPDVVTEVTGQPVYNVFIPNSPIPTAGWLVLLPESKINEIDMSVSKGMQLIVTTGFGADSGATALPMVESDEQQ